jgi:hypothetical protein
MLSGREELKWKNLTLGESVSLENSVNVLSFFPQCVANTGGAGAIRILSVVLSRTFFREIRLQESGVSTGDEL